MRLRAPACHGVAVPRGRLQPALICCARRVVATGFLVVAGWLVVATLAEPEAHATSSAPADCSGSAAALDTVSAPTSATAACSQRSAQRLGSGHHARRAAETVTASEESVKGRSWAGTRPHVRQVRHTVSQERADAGRRMLISGSLKRIGADRIRWTLVAAADRLQRSALAAVQPQALGAASLPVSLPSIDGVLVLPVRSPKVLSDASEGLPGSTASLRSVVQASSALSPLAESPSTAGAYSASAPSKAFTRPEPRPSSLQSPTLRQAAGPDLVIRTGSDLADRAGEPTRVPPAASGGHHVGGASNSSGHGPSALGTLGVTRTPPASPLSTQRTRLAKAPTASVQDVPVPVPD